MTDENVPLRKPEVDTAGQKIDKIIKRIDDGDIKIPAFQRGFVWKQEQIIELLESIIRDFPIGSVLLWETSDKEKLKSARNIAGYLIPAKSESYPVNYVLDGQQRISSIYGVFSDKLEQDLSSKDYNPDPNIFEIYFDFLDGKFKTKEETDPTSKHVVYLRNLIHPTKVFDEIGRIDEQYRVQAKELSSKFLNYDLPVVTIKNRSRSDVGVIFERVNNTGTKLDIVDLMTAWTWTEDFHLMDAINELSLELEEKGFGTFGNKLILQTISTVIQGSTTTEKILSLSGEQVRDNWDKVCEAMKKSIDFLSTEIKCLNSDFLPFHQQLIPLVAFFHEKKNPSAAALANLKKWFWRTSFSNRYSTGQTTDKMDADIAAIKEIAEDKTAGLNKYSYNVTKEDLISAQFSKTNPLTRAFLLLMAQSAPLDLIKGVKVDLDKSLSSFNRKEYHHVFPNGFLKKNAVPKTKRFSLVNFCFLPADSNKKISNKEPKDYFTNLVPALQFKEIVDSNILPNKADIYTKNDYQEFLNVRVQLILSKIDGIT